MRAWVLVSLGLMLAIAGFLFGLLNTGVYFIADCSADCVARGERAVAALLALAGYAVAAGGIALLVVTRRRMRARARRQPPH